MFAGVEIGASKLQVILADAQGTPMATLQHAVERDKGADGILRWVTQAIHTLCAQTKEPLEGIGVGFGGIVSRTTGCTLLSVQVHGWESYPLRDAFELAFHVPCIVENDTVCGGLAEFWLGSGKGTQGFFYTNIGSGIGGALFSGGNLLVGQEWGCAYFGHTWVPSWTQPNAAEKIENLCSGFAIENRLNTPEYVPENSLLYSEKQAGRLSCRQLGLAAEAGDAFALAEIDRVARTFAIGLGNVLTLLHPQRIAIGGGVSHLGETLLQPMRGYAREFAFEPCKDGFEIVPCHYPQEAVPLGAALLAAKRKGL